MKTRITINIIGRGNVATHLNLAFSDKADVRLVNPHTFEELDPNADLTLISVSDSAIKSVIVKMPKCSGVIAHTSGSTDISVFKGYYESFGVFYPPQTFTKNKPLQYDRIPFFIEGVNESVTEFLTDTAQLVSNNVYPADSTKRKALHIASVFSCNFVNHLWAIADEYLQRNDLQFSALLPLIEETINKVKEIPPMKAQTGPASRGDMNIVNSHIEMLKYDPLLCKLYEDLSMSIIRKGKES